MKKMLQKEDKQKELGRISKDIFERNTRAPLFKATVTWIDTGITTIIDTQNEIIEAAVESNCRCQCKTKGTAFRSSPFLPDFGYCADNKKNANAVLDEMWFLQEQISTLKN